MSGSNDQTGAWHEGVTSAQWVVLAAASAGWVFDVYEGQLFTIFKTPMLIDLLGGDKAAVSRHADIAFALFLVGGAIGGLGFGVLADRIGRVKVMSWTILAYSIFSALTFFARSVFDVEALRFLVALGTGGEWAVAAALVAETFPVRARAVAAGIFHASSVLGSILASITGVVLKEPGQWRWGFLLGLAPALLTLWFRQALHEPAGWQRTRETATNQTGRLSELLGDPQWRGRALLGLGLASVGLATFWGVFAYGPDLAGSVLKAGATDGDRQQAGSFAYLLMNFTGGALGLLAFAPLAAWKGRRFAFAAYQLGALVVVPATFLGVTTYNQALVFLPIMAFFVLGLHAGYAVYLPELFPTRLRATGSSFCFNVGRVLGAGMLLVRGSLAASLGLRLAVVAMSGLFVVGLALLMIAPETKGKDLIE